MKDYQLFLFDMDGTLVNSEPLKGQAIAKACAVYGAKVDYHHYQEVMGQNWGIVTQFFFDKANISPDINEFNQIFKKHYQDLLLQALQLTPGALQYLTYLQLQGRSCGLVTSAAKWMVNDILQALNLTAMFEVIITKEDVSKHKPDPAAYLLALNKLSMSPNNTVIFEDSFAGISAGIASGCDVIAIQHEFNINNNLSVASKVISDFRELIL